MTACPENEAYRDCFSECEDSCASKLAKKPCPKGPCKLACYCVEGYARNLEGNKCVPVDKCPGKSQKMQFLINCILY